MAHLPTIPLLPSHIKQNNIFTTKTFSKAFHTPVLEPMPVILSSFMTIGEDNLVKNSLHGQDGPRMLFV